MINMYSCYQLSLIDIITKIFQDRKNSEKGTR